MAESPSICGSCSCGNISWTSTAQPQHLDFCYCITCQKVSGAPFMAWMGVPKASLQWKFSRTEPFLYRSNVGDTEISVAERTYCRSCGCNISLQYYLYPGKTHVAAPTTDKNGFEPLKVGCHIWTKSLPSWYSIPNDGVARFPKFDDDFQLKLDEYLKQKSSKSSTLKERGGWWAGLMPGELGDAPSYEGTPGPDNMTMGDLWNDPQKARRPA